MINQQGNKQYRPVDMAIKCIPRNAENTSLTHRDDGDTLQVVGGVPSNSEHPMGQRLTPGLRLTVYTVLCICIHIYIYIDTDIFLYVCICIYLYLL